jgi:hypothetical protein
MNRDIQTRIAFAVVCWFSSVSVAAKCRADLYTSGAASLEWKVDSADEVYLAEIVEDADAKHGLRFQPLEVLMADREMVSFPHATVHQCQLGRCLDPLSPFSETGDRWLIFVRGDDNNARVSGAISLTHPTADWAENC